MRSVFLIGMPAVGKTYWGALWARHYTIPFIDLDVLIEQETGSNSADIISEQGEVRFRLIEAAALRKSVAGNGAALIATGGGTPTYQDNMEWMLQHGTVVWLQGDVAYLMKNLARSSAIRPLLPEEGLEAAMRELLEKRTPFYQKAQLHYPAEGLTIATFAAIQEACTNLH